VRDQRVRAPSGPSSAGPTGGRAPVAPQGRGSHRTRPWDRSSAPWCALHGSGRQLRAWGMRRPWKLRHLAHNAPGQREGAKCDTLVRRPLFERPVAGVASVGHAKAMETSPPRPQCARSASWGRLRYPSTGALRRTPRVEGEPWIREISGSPVRRRGGLALGGESPSRPGP
jgi:hypothetical protein